MSCIIPRTITTKSGRTVVIRSAEVADAQTLLDLVVDFDLHSTEFTVTQPDERSLTLEKEQEFISSHLDGPNMVAIIAEIGGRAVGMLNFKCQERRRIAHSGHFGISVHSEFQNDGIGAALIQALLDWAATHPIVEKVCLGVFAQNTRAIHLYTKLGFREDFRKLREFKLGPGEYADDVQMSIWVKQV